MKAIEVIHAWGRILRGYRPSLSIEITRECPLRCPGCYAYEDNHLGGGTTLRQLSDFKGEALVRGVLEVVDRYKPLHTSIVGGDPLVRYRELEEMLPLLVKKTHVQLVTSAFREVPARWAQLENFNVVVSIDGLPEEHNARRAPATYDRILKSLAGHDRFITVHCTLTGQIMKRAGYLEEFVKFWSDRPEVKKIWFSIFTPQMGDELPEILTKAERAYAVEEILRLRKIYPRLEMPEGLVKEFLKPPTSPEKCIFAQTTHTLSADLKTRITPCQFGGQPDCSQCGCVASMALAAVGDHKVLGPLTAGQIFWVSTAIGRRFDAVKAPPAPPRNVVTTIVGPAQTGAGEANNAPVASAR